MSVTDILIILIILLGAYFGYVNGFIKQLSDTIILYIYIKGSQRTKRSGPFIVLSEMIIRIYNFLSKHTPVRDNFYISMDQVLGSFSKRMVYLSLQTPA